MNHIVIEALGYIGAGLILLAYILVSTDRLKAKTVPYQVMNAAGASLLVVYLLERDAYPSVVLNAVWLLVAVLSLLKLVGSKRKGY